ncbi:MAG: NAD(P)H-dependent oxidoreductase subunit E [Kiritimatiellae bacterium]|nr:NAD(P)H-dependent oxidoreductase subunit E [Kiritimatiellia bacterium]
MSATVTVEICMGTACYVMGGAQLASIADRLPEEWKDRVTVKGMRCVGACQQTGQYGRAPFVRVNDELISEADEGKVLNAIRSILEA